MERPGCRRGGEGEERGYETTCDVRRERERARGGGGGGAKSVWRNGRITPDSGESYRARRPFLADPRRGPIRDDRRMKTLRGGAHFSLFFSDPSEIRRCRIDVGVPLLSGAHTHARPRTQRTVDRRIFRAGLAFNPLVRRGKMRG